MAEVLAEFYVFTREKAVADLTRVRFFDGADAAVLALDTTDSRLVWSVTTGNPIKLKCTLSGDDAGLNGVVIKTMRLYRQSDTTHANPVAAESLATAVTLATGRDDVFELSLEIKDIP